MDDSMTDEGTDTRSAEVTLAVEIDRLSVGALVFAEVEGQHRFLAAARDTTLPGPQGLSAALAATLKLASQQSGYALTPEGEHPIDVGPVGVSGQPVRATRVALVVAGHHATLVEPLIAAARATPSTVELMSDSILTDEGNVSGAQLESALRSFEPDVVLLLAGDQAQRQWGTVVGTLAPLLQTGIVGQVVVLGPEDLQQHVIQTVGEDTNLMGLDPADYDLSEVASAVEIELQSVFDSRVAEYGIAGLPGSPEFLSRGRSLDLVTRFLARRGDRAVSSIYIDDGTTLAWADPTTGILVNRPDMDARFSARTALAWNPTRITRQLPFGLQLDDLHNWIMNRQIRPESRAERPRDQLIEAALMSEIARRVWSESIDTISGSRTELLVVGPSFAQWESPAIGVLSLLNALPLRPADGIVDLIMDGEGIAVAAGAIGELVPAVAADAVEQDLAVPIASIVVVDCSRSGSEGELAVRGELTVDEGDTEQFSVPYGSIHRLSVPEGAEASLRIVCEEGFAIRGQHELEFDEPRRVRGSQLGIVIDARGWSQLRESDQPVDPERVLSWYADLGYSPEL